MERPRAGKTNNELFREMIKQCDRNLLFDYVATDSWFSSVENMQWVKEELNRNFVMALKSNRKVALSLEAKQKVINTLRRLIFFREINVRKVSN